MNLNRQDLKFAVMRLPANLKKIMLTPEWSNRIYVGGGFIRCTISNEPVNDIDIFVGSATEAEHLALKLAADQPKRYRVHKTDNAYTIIGTKPTLQIIHRWVFEKPEDVANSFDFTICCAVISVLVVPEKGTNVVTWQTYCDDAFYQDLAAKRLVYRHPVRNEDAGGSALRLLKYYQKGFRAPINTYAGVMARLFLAIDWDMIKQSADTHEKHDPNWGRESQVTKVLTGLLHVVDPNVDPLHEAHLPDDTITDIEEETPAE